MLVREGGRGRGRGEGLLLVNMLERGLRTSFLTVTFNSLLSHYIPRVGKPSLLPVIRFTREHLPFSERAPARKISIHPYFERKCAHCGVTQWKQQIGIIGDPSSRLYGCDEPLVNKSLMVLDIYSIAASLNGSPRFRQP